MLKSIELLLTNVLYSLLSNNKLNDKKNTIVVQAANIKQASLKSTFRDAGCLEMFTLWLVYLIFNHKCLLKYFQKSKFLIHFMELKIKKNHQLISSAINKFAKTKTRKVKYCNNQKIQNSKCNIVMHIFTVKESNAVRQSRLMHYIEFQMPTSMTVKVPRRLRPLAVVGVMNCGRGKGWLDRFCWFCFIVGFLRLVRSVRNTCMCGKVFAPYVPRWSPIRVLVAAAVAYS
ncbi:hypothetical protein AGLY_008023 [Aphis glycines]|uniref:Uncharacterized protein n=1 Tax=Aphis glycines TaxID=307491 RepID=A0A6G0TM60_APHGL|nr:hypothetical protein AGLY_008023 [Aphis glycines]